MADQSKRHFLHLPQTRSYQGDSRHLVENGWQPRLYERGGALFALGNGLIGARGVFEEDERRVSAVYLNGVYERLPIRYHEGAHGLASASDSRPPVADGLRIGILLGDDVVDLGAGEVLDYRRTLDFEQGLLRREVHWRSPAGREIEFSFERVISFDHPGLMAIRLKLRALNFRDPVTLISTLRVATPGAHAGDDPRAGGHFAANPWRLERRIASDDATGFIHRARNSGIAVAAAVSHDRATDPVHADDEILHHFRFDADAPIELCKFIAYASDFGDRGVDIESQATQALHSGAALGFDGLLSAQRKTLDDFWRHADCGVAGDEALDCGLGFAAFQIFQAVGRGGRLSVGAKGQTGEGYEGHYFWDAEIFTLPLLAYAAPSLARDMLAYRHAILPQARENARLLGHGKGALFPWRTISGAECSSYFLAGSAQYHINADIAYAIRHYVEVSGDRNFLYEKGAEILFETARIWADIGFFNPRRDGGFSICGVTGPDEYTVLADNNFYTNAMARTHLRYAVLTAENFKRDADGAYAALAAKIGLDDAEIGLWRRAAQAMLLPYDPALGIHKQDDTFLEKPLWDFAGTPAEQYPLLLHFHPLHIYRHQVCKQADVLMATFLLRDQFDPADRRRDFEYYETVTVHDSTLSAGIFASMAADAGDGAKALDYLRAAAMVDLEDLHGNTGHGLHIASMGASWMALSHGLGGMRGDDGNLRFRPMRPSGLSGYRFRVGFQGRLVEVAAHGGEISYRLVEGAALPFHHDDEALTLQTGETLTRPLRAQP